MNGNIKIKIKKINENLSVNLNSGIVEIGELGKNFDLVGSSNIISIKKAIVFFYDCFCF